jgi:hypothetical protein
VLDEELHQGRATTGKFSNFDNQSPIKIQQNSMESDFPKGDDVGSPISKIQTESGSQEASVEKEYNPWA